MQHLWTEFVGDIRPQLHSGPARPRTKLTRIPGHRKTNNSFPGLEAGALGQGRASKPSWPSISGALVPVFKHRPSLNPDRGKGTAWNFLGGRGVLEVLGKDVLGRALLRGTGCSGGRPGDALTCCGGYPLGGSKAGELDSPLVKLSYPIMSRLASWQPDQMLDPTLRGLQ